MGGSGGLDEAELAEVLSSAAVGKTPAQHVARSKTKTAGSFSANLIATPLSKQSIECMDSAECDAGMLKCGMKVCTT